MTDTPLDYDNLEFLDVPEADDEPPKPSKKFFGRKSYTEDKSESKKKSKINTPPPGQAEKLCANLANYYRFAGMAISAVDKHCGQAVVYQAEDLGNSWVELARSNPPFRRFLARMQQASGLGTVLAAHMPLIAAVASHHNPRLFSQNMEYDVETENEYSAT